MTHTKRMVKMKFVTTGFSKPCGGHFNASLYVHRKNGWSLISKELLQRYRIHLFPANLQDKVVQMVGRYHKGQHTNQGVHVCRKNYVIHTEQEHLRPKAQSFMQAFIQQGD
jgi:hypothetical protein